MAYPCPHCGQNARRSPSAGGWEAGGFLGWILCSAMADFDCPRCGKILREEFAPEVQQQMTSGTYTMVAVGGVLAMASMIVALMIHFLR